MFYEPLPTPDQMMLITNFYSRQIFGRFVFGEVLGFLGDPKNSGEKTKKEKSIIR